MSTLLNGSENELLITQRREISALLGFEGRNKYEIADGAGRRLGFAAEKGKGLLAAVGRQFLGHWRSFEIIIFDVTRTAQLIARHPFRPFFQRMEVRSATDGTHYGAIQQRAGRSEPAARRRALHRPAVFRRSGRQRLSVASCMRSYRIRRAPHAQTAAYPAMRARGPD